MSQSARSSNFVVPFRRPSVSDRFSAADRSLLGKSRKRLVDATPFPFSETHRRLPSRPSDNRPLPRPARFRNPSVRNPTRPLSDIAMNCHSERLHNYCDSLSAADTRRREAVSSSFCASIRTSTVIVSRVPDAPSGWPNAIAPPLTLTLFRSSSSAFSTARYCAANASLISIRSMSR